MASLFCRLPRFLWRLSHHDARRPQQTVVKRVAVFQNLDDAAGWLFGLIRLHHRFVLAGIERLVEGADFLDAESIENLCQNAIGGGHARDQSVYLSSVPLGGAEGTAQIVDNLKQFAGEVRDRILLGVLRAPFTLTPGILGLGQRPHQPLTQCCDFGCRIVIIAVARSCRVDIVVHGVFRHVMLPISYSTRQREASMFQDALRPRGSTSSNSASTMLSSEAPPPSPDDPACPPAPPAPCEAARVKASAVLDAACCRRSVAWWIDCTFSDVIFCFTSATACSTCCLRSAGILFSASFRAFSVL